QTRRECVLRVGPGATGDGGVDELRVGVLLPEHLDEGVETGLLGAGCPPGEHLDFAGVVRSAVVSAVAVVPVAAGAAGERESSDTQTRYCGECFAHVILRWMKKAAFRGPHAMRYE